MHLQLFKKIWRLPQAALKRFVSDLLRIALLSNRPRRMAQAGFVLPTTVLLTLMVVLTATALTYRSFTRSEQAIVQREQQVIANAATPAIDRAKAKIEFMFRQDPRFPSGLPSSDILSDLMSTKLSTKDFAGYTGRVQLLEGGVGTGAKDPYTLADETRVDINNDGLLDNAWSFPSGDKTIIYSILVDDSVATKEANAPGTGENYLPRPYATKAIALEDPANSDKANALVTRTGPLATTESTPKCQGALSDQGWQVVTRGTTSDLQKNFQVNAFVASNNGGPGQSFETLEFQQSRQASRASKWGAWFRYDLEIFPGAAFNWNGAMHTDSNLIINRDELRLHMVSSHNSCVYSKESSEITLGESKEDSFQGQVIQGTTKDDAYAAAENPILHVFDGLGNRPEIDAAEVSLTRDNHSVTGGKPSDVSVNALTLFTQDRTNHINTTTWTRRAGWENGIFFAGGRTINNVVARPFVDDFYRADDRWGPKPRYDAETDAYDITKQSGTVIGDPLTGAGALTDKVVGLDGYWERQAIKSGLRLIVGQRLELGNNQEWNLDPLEASMPNPDVGRPGKNALYPSQGRPAIDARYGGNHEYLQRRSLQDNLAAVQGMVVYHYQGGDTEKLTTDGEFPAACVAMTAHPGTRQSIVNSRTFGVYPEIGRRRIDFLNGIGTNGWEFRLPSAFNTEGKFGQQIAADKALGIALRNLANFAGDPAGGAPSFPAIQDAFVHPFPYHSMWGDFSPLRRILIAFDAATGNALDKYRALSFADKATLHSAACTISMLAYNLQEAEAEYTQILKNYPTLPSSLNARVSPGASKMVTDISNYLAARMNPTNPNYNKYTGNTGTDLTIQNALAGLPSGSQNKVWTDSNPATVVTNPKDSTTVCAAGVDTAGFQPACDSAEFFSQLTFDDWVYLLQQLAPTVTATDVNDLKAIRQTLVLANSMLRDRELGFRDLDTTSDEVDTIPPSGSAVTYDPSTKQSEAVTTTDAGAAYVFATGCNPNLFSAVTEPDDKVMSGLVACAKINEAKAPVRYPSLFYLFPLVDHGLLGSGDHLQPHTLSDGTAAKLPDGVTPIPGDSEYVDAINVYKDQYTTYGASAPTFKVVLDPSSTTYTTARDGLYAIAAEPRLSTDLANWVLPVKATTTALTTSNVDDLASAFKVNYRDTVGATFSVLRLPFIDKGIFDGREHLNTRVLDIDLELLTQEKMKHVASPDYWLPADREKQGEGVFYAFREDAVREDEIIRPQNSGASDCTGTESVSFTQRFRLETRAECRMQVRNPSIYKPTASIVTNNQDPPLTAQGISLKPVDFIPDPERRPHGFRLRTASGNPATFTGNTNPKNGRQVGMTLVTDNSVYILGDFNLHTTDGTTSSIVEEFVAGQTLYDDSVAYGDDFYTNRTTLNTDTFANLEKDHWRPVEILSDGISVLSKNFRDGAIEDTVLRARPAAEGGANSSYMNQNRPIFNTDLAANTQLRNQLDVNGAGIPLAPTDTSPVYIDRNGTYYNSGKTPFYTTYSTDADWTNFGIGDGLRRRNTQTPPDDTFVNATFVSGIVPKRPKQSYGGLHNYPRFLERWSGKDLFIAGSFIQLNFSTAATGPYEQDAWEDGAEPQDAEPIGYYNAPNRRWGYDVALLYVPPAPAARRFVTIGAPRSEYYREIAADDPYIVNLRCARDASKNLVLGDICPS